MAEMSSVSSTLASTGESRARLMASFWGAAALSVVLSIVPLGRYVVYPFTILGTWAHEMGHGLMAVALGGSFEKLILLSDGSGLAYHRGVGDLGSALVSAAGLLGPALFGAAVIVGGARHRTAPWVLAALAVLAALSVVLVVRNLFGVVAMSLISAVLVPVALRAPHVVRMVVAQLIGIRFCLASWGSLDYMFTERVTIDGRTQLSDTGAIADQLLLPYWFWGGAIAAASFAVLAWAFVVAWIRPRRGAGGAVTVA